MRDAVGDPPQSDLTGFATGRGNRSLCPKYDPGRDATPSRALHPGDASQPTPGQANTFPGSDILVDKSTGQPALPRGPYADIGVYNSLNSPGTWRSPGGTTQDGDQSTSAPRTERILIPGTIPRKRGPRHCGVCKQLNCPGNGNRFVPAKSLSLCAQLNGWRAVTGNSAASSRRRTPLRKKEVLTLSKPRSSPSKSDSLCTGIMRVKCDNNLYLGTSALACH